MIAISANTDSVLSFRLLDDTGVAVTTATCTVDIHNPLGDIVRTLEPVPYVTSIYRVTIAKGWLQVNGVSLRGVYKAVIVGTYGGAQVQYTHPFEVR